jgi:ferric iron reductase protein FhuF
MNRKNNIPLFASWKQWYIAVLVVLLLLIAFFTWLSNYYA